LSAIYGAGLVKITVNTVNPANVTPPTTTATHTYPGNSTDITLDQILVEAYNGDSEFGFDVRFAISISVIVSYVPTSQAEVPLTTVTTNTTTGATTTTGGALPKLVNFTGQPVPGGDTTRLILQYRAAGSGAAWT